MGDGESLSADLRSLLSALAHAPESAPAPDVTIAPGDRIGRYALEGVLGRGGFGVVFAARDESLGRPVAIKVARGQRTDEALARFHREAQVAARLNHPNLVTLHDSGTVEGLPYLILELLDGETLAERLARGPLLPREALAVAADVLRALGHAHAHGIVHLDLKPSNVFVTREGRVKVLDFGLARLRDHQGRERSGTPAYMAPEQWRGEATDARTDVFAAGVLLYELVSGTLPFRADRERSEVLDGKPAPQLKVKAGPPALRSIVARALELDPARRFDGAAPMLAAVAAAARPRRPWLLWSGAALAVAALALVVQLRQHRAAVEAARAAERIGRQTLAIESQLRFARLRPLHDLRPDEADARGKLNALAVELERVGDVGEGTKELALGRGALALRDLPSARAHLEAAVQRGYETPAVYASLGETLLAQYGDRVAMLVHADPEQRKQRMAALDATLRDPGLADLRRASEASPLALARIALYEKRYDEARKLAADALRLEPGQYEADVLIGDSWQMHAYDVDLSGDYTSELADLQRAGAAFAEGRAIARSDGTLETGDCRRWVNVLHLAGVTGGDGEAPFAEGVVACGRALAAQPDSVPALVQAARLRDMRASYLTTKGRDGTAVLDDGLRMLATARAARPDDADLASTAALLHMTHAYLDNQHGKDPRPDVAAGEAALAIVTRQRPGDDTRLTRAMLLVQRAEYEVEHAIDPSATVQRGLQALDGRMRAVERTLAGELATVRARWDVAHGGDPRAMFDVAAAAFAQARAARPNDTHAADEEGGAWQIRAQWESVSGVDPIPSLEQAIACSERVLAVDQDDAYGHGNLGEVLIQRAAAESQRGGDARPILERAVASLERARALNSSSHDILVNLAQAHAQLAKALVTAERDAAPELRLARQWLARAQQLERDDLVVLPITCEIERAAAESALRRRESPSASFARARVACAGALALDGDNADANFQLADLLAELGDWKRAAGRGGDEERDEAAQRLRVALTARPRWKTALDLQAKLRR